MVSMRYDNVPFCVMLKATISIIFPIPLFHLISKEVVGVRWTLFLKYCFCFYKSFVFSMFGSSMETHKKLSNWFSIPTQGFFPFFLEVRKNGWKMNVIYHS